MIKRVTSPEGSCTSKAFSSKRNSYLSNQGNDESKPNLYTSFIEITGTSKLKKEIECCLSIPQKQRALMLNHLSNEGEGEPEEDDMVIIEHSDPTLRV